MPRASRRDFRLDFWNYRSCRGLKYSVVAEVLVLAVLYIIGFGLLARFLYLLGHSDKTDGDFPSWSGWSGVDYLFTFGDSYTTTGFDVHGIQPVSGNPLGNHDGHYPYGTEVGSPNYVEYLTTKYNQSLILTYNFGYPGGTIDNQIDQSPYGSYSLREQVEREFVPDFGNAQQYRSWTANNSLFTSFMGINDVAMFNSNPNVSDYVTALVSSYGNATEQLYDAGARNFLFINVPAIDRSPDQIPKEATSKQVADSVKLLNIGLKQFTEAFRVKHSDSAVFFLDSNTLTNSVLDNPKSHTISSVIRNTTAYCEAYEKSPDPNLYNASCGIPRNEYFWADWLHPTSTVHDLIANEIVNEVLRHHA